MTEYDWAMAFVLILALSLSLVAVLISLATQKQRGPMGPTGAMGATGPKGDPGERGTCECLDAERELELADTQPIHPNVWRYPDLKEEVTLFGHTEPEKFTSGVDRDDEAYHANMTKEKLYGLPPDKLDHPHEPGSLYRAAWVGPNSVRLGPHRFTLAEAQEDIVAFAWPTPETLLQYLPPGGIWTDL